MAGFLQAHGQHPGATQRPLLAGALAGLVATAPAVSLLYGFATLAVEARILALPIAATLGVGWIIMAMAGAVYARLFGRTANDVRGGWLFGMAYGFALWAVGGVLILPAASGGLAPAGSAAIGLFLSLLLWGAFLGGLLPFIQRPLHANIESAARRNEAGPEAATKRRGPRAGR